MSGGCVLLSGTGKSGTKRMLKILDRSPRTCCRCEPNQLAASPFADFPSREVREEGLEDALAAGWDAAVDRAVLRFGERDRFPLTPKDHVRRLAVRLQLHRAVNPGRIHRALAVAFPSLRGTEWLLPGFLVDREKLARAVAVLKTGPMPVWGTWLLANRPDVKILDVVRHPAGFLHSHLGRYLSRVDVGENARVGRDRLLRIAAYDPGLRDRADEIGRMTAVETEMWYWRHVYESLDGAGDGNAAYRLVRDEDVVFDPVTTARGVYDFCGLEFPDGLEEYLTGMAPHWSESTAPWREVLDAEHVPVIERVLEGSRMEDWWEPDQRISLYTYRA